MSPEFVNALNKLHHEVNGRIDRFVYVIRVLRRWQKVYEEEEKQRIRKEWLDSLDPETRKMAVHCSCCTDRMYNEHLDEAAASNN